MSLHQGQALEHTLNNNIEIIASMDYHLLSN